ncbi:2'-5' RNA ligase family protein [Microvirga guangxiensis]|nr:2'-5' RNA ligase family protein [Microvirga guangxiensis]
MLQTIADDIWGQRCLAYHVQPHLSAETQASLAQVQETIAGCWPVPLFMAPPEALHVTLYPFVQVKHRFDKEAYWSSIFEPCRALVEGICRGHPPLELRFSRLKVTDTAIIAIADDESGLIDEMRGAIVEVIPPPPGQRPIFYDLIHTTLARYRTPDMIPDEIVAAVEAIPVSVTAPVERLKIIRETVFPCQGLDEIHSFPLA